MISKGPEFGYHPSPLPPSPVGVFKAVLKLEGVVTLTEYTLCTMSAQGTDEA